MKLRTGFVSNSSSCSFIVKLKDLTTVQKEAITHCVEYAIAMDWLDESTRKGYLSGSEGGMYTDNWEIAEYNDTLRGCTVIDNFEMQEFFKHLEIPDSKVQWGDNYSLMDTISLTSDDEQVLNRTLLRFFEDYKVKSILSWEADKEITSKEFTKRLISHIKSR